MVLVTVCRQASHRGKLVGVAGTTQPSLATTCLLNYHVPGPTAYPGS